MAATLGYGRADLIAAAREQVSRLSFVHNERLTNPAQEKLARGDGREGGVLCVAPPASGAALRASLGGAGFEVRHWDNGTPERMRAGQGPARK
jgi:hypothetical protein